MKKLLASLSFAMTGFVVVYSGAVNALVNTSVDCEKLLSNASTNLLKDIVDIHGLEGQRAQQLLHKHNPIIQNIEASIMAEFMDMNQGHIHPYRYECLMERKKQWLAHIKNEEHFEFVDLQTVYYPGKTNIYTTVEVVEDPKDERMRFVAENADSFFGEMKIKFSNLKRKVFHAHDVIERMQEFYALSMRLLFTHQLDNDADDCPVYHCIASFQHPQLRPYLPVFQRGVVQDKPWIINTLRNDPDPERRAAAAFLIGHFQDPKEIVSILSGSIDDSASHVRNNVLRVIITTLQKAKIKNIDCSPFIKLLDSPYLTDRNKALNILLVLADDESCKTQIIQQASNSLNKLSYGTQPNNHDAAEMLLKKISPVS